MTLFGAMGRYIDTTLKRTRVGRLFDGTEFPLEKQGLGPLPTEMIPDVLK